MKKLTLMRGVSLAPILLPLMSMLVLSSCQKDIGSDQTSATSADLIKKNPQVLKDFNQVNLISDDPAFNPVTVDPNLVNGWGIAFSSGGTPWISSTGKGLSLVYNVAGVQVRPPVAIPSPAGPTGGPVTGAVFNSSPDFVLSNGGSARFIFDGLDGTISGWNPAAGNFALTAFHKAGAVYTGLAIGQSNGNNYLYAADFAGNSIDVLDKNFVEVNMAFEDPDIPEGFAPFNIQAVGNHLFVMYAKVGVGAADAAPGLGYVSVFNTDGSFVKRFASRGQLNAPWGIAQAPAGFFDANESASDNTPIMLIGNFGDGRINAFDNDGNFLGQLRAHGNPIVIEGLWAISFAPTTATAVDPNRLFFAAGPGDEKHGLFGYISK